MLPVLSEIKPIISGATAPPIIDITRKDEAIFVSSPRPLIPKANIVGNMIDIKKGTAITAYTATVPDVVNATVSSTKFMVAYSVSNFAGFI